MTQWSTGRPRRLDDAFLSAGSSSFSEFVSAYRPELLPSGRRLPSGASIEAPHGTTIVSLLFDGGVVMAGDRRATMGNVIANRDMEKVFAADDYSVVGIAGTAGIAIELVRLYQVELEHYEKIEGAIMSLEGKANRLASMIRGNLSLAMQGLTVVPTYAGFDLESATGRIYSYDAADDDSATGGPDLGRQIWPTVAVVDHSGARFVASDVLEGHVQRVVAARRDNPGGAR